VSKFGGDSIRSRVTSADVRARRHVGQVATDLLITITGIYVDRAFHYFAQSELSARFFVESLSIAAFFAC
jgi:hypothetical protein